MINAVAEPAVLSTLPKEGFCSVILNSSVLSINWSSTTAMVTVAVVAPAGKVNVVIPAAKSPVEEERERQKPLCIYASFGYKKWP